MVIDKNTFTVSEVSHMLNCSNQKTYQLIRTGQLKGAYKDAFGRVWKIPDDSVIDYWFAQGREYEKIISFSIQQPQPRNEYSAEIISNT